MKRTKEKLSVNFEGNITHDVNISKQFHLSQQMRKILQFLYQYRGHVWQQVEIISNIYPDEPYLTESRIASLSRSMKVLMKAQLVESRKAYYSDQFSCWFPQRVQYFLTEKGEHFVKERLKGNAISLESRNAS